MEVVMVLALNSPLAHIFLLSQGFFPLSLDKIIKREAGLGEGSHSPFQKKPLSKSPFFICGVESPRPHSGG